MDLTFNKHFRKLTSKHVFPRTLKTIHLGLISLPIYHIYPLTFTFYAAKSQNLTSIMFLRYPLCRVCLCSNQDMSCINTTRAVDHLCLHCLFTNTDAVACEVFESSHLTLLNTRRKKKHEAKDRHITLSYKCYIMY